MPGLVTVACKLPHGLILRLFDMQDKDEPAGGGGMRTVKAAVVKGDPVRINGAAVAHGVLPEHLIIGGYGLTPGVDADFFEAWLKQNKDLDLVRNGLVFAHAKDTAGQAREAAARRSGLEPLDGDKPGTGLSRLANMTA